jgi:hypothetical protein
VNTLRVLYHLARADFLERMRRRSVLIVLGLTILAGYFLIPPAGARYVVGINIYDVRSTDYFRGVYNSAWVGGMVALMTACFLSLSGFYLVKNAVERDQQTRVGEIIATTPLSKSSYTLGKWLSNLAVLTVMVGTLVAAAAVTQLIRGEVLRIDAWALLAPFLFIALPVLALVAALAILFETIPGLRGGLGNVVYFFLWSATLPAGIAGNLFGLTLIDASVMTAAQTAFPQYELGASWGINPEVPGHIVLGRLQTFRWEGIQWAPEIVVGRLQWVGLALGLVLLAALFFHRFDPAHGLFQRLGVSARRTRPVDIPSAAPEVSGTFPVLAATPLTPLTAVPMRFRFGRLLLAELRLMLKGVRWWWFAVAATLILANLVVADGRSGQILLPVAWLWPLLIWSGMGTRETRHRVEELVFSMPHVLRRQLPAIWLAGVIVTALAGSGAATRLALVGDGIRLLAWAVAVLFIPALALALGVWSGSSKLFEVVYTAWWYVGPINGIVFLDFMGVTDGPITVVRPLYYLALTGVLLGLAAVGRRRQLQV